MMLTFELRPGRGIGPFELGLPVRWIWRGKTGEREREPSHFEHLRAFKICNEFA